MNFQDLDLEKELESTESAEPAILDLDLIKQKIPTHSSKKLCDMIVCDRYLGFNEELSVMCMEELGKRRAAGDNFDFENYIDTELKNLPQLNFTGGIDLRTVLNQAIVRKK